MRRSSRDRIAGIIALATLTLLVVGVPLLLARIAGWPLPRSIPDWGNVRRAVIQGDFPAEVVVNVLAVVVWLIWLQLVWALLWELVVNVPRLTAGDQPRPAPMVASSVSTGMGRLVAMVLAVGVVIASTPVPAMGLPAVTAAASVEAPAQARQHDRTLSMATPAMRHDVSTLQWRVERSDSLWKIAESALGDGERAGEILEINRWLGSPRNLKAGHVLTLPVGADVPPDRVPLPAVEPAVVESADHTDAVAYLEPTHIVIAPGDTLWGLAESRLGVVDDDVTPAETLAQVNEVVAGNPDVIEDPNLIYPGEVFAFPAVGTPPPPDVSPPFPPPPLQPPGDGTVVAEVPSQPDLVPLDSPEVAPDVVVPGPESEGTAPELVPPLPPTTVTSPPIASPPLDAVDAPAEASRSAVIPWLAGVSGATALASGLLLFYRRKLAVRAARGARAYRATVPSEPGVLDAITRASDVSLLRWANAALARLMSELRPGDVAGQPLAIELSEAFGVEMLWTEANHAAPVPWQVADDGWAWHLRFDPDEAVPNAEQPAAIPALVTIGRRNGNQLLLNLEAVGTLAVDGGDPAASDFVRSIVAELAVGDLLSDAFLVASGVDLDGLAAADRVQQRDRADAADALRSAVETSQVFLWQHTFATMFESRLGGDAAGRESTVVAVDDEYAEPLDHSVVPGLGACLLYTGAATDGSRMDLLDDGSAVLHPYGIEFDPAALPLSTLATVSALLDEASEPYTPTASEDPVMVAETPTVVLIAEEEPEGDLGVDDDWAFPEPEVLVRVLGAPEVVAVPLGRIETSIVTYLACHGGKRRDDQVINAVWNGRAVEPKTLWNKISKIRSVLGPNLVPPRLPNSPNVLISEGVMTDLDVLACLHARSSEVAESEAIRLLLHGLDLVDGVPFDSAEYDWAFETQDHATACELVEAATLRCVDIALNLGDLTAARHAVTQGLRALPMNEPLYRARMRVESASGNADGVRQALGELTTALGGSSPGDVDQRPCAETVRLAGELTSAR